MNQKFGRVLACGMLVVWLSSVDAQAPVEPPKTAETTKSAETPSPAPQPPAEPKSSGEPKPGEQPKPPASEPMPPMGEPKPGEQPKPPASEPMPPMGEPKPGEQPKPPASEPMPPMGEPKPGEQPKPPASESMPPMGEPKPREQPKPPMGEPMPPMGTPAVPPAPQQPKNPFALKLEKDKPFFQKITSEVTQTIKVQGGADRIQRHEQTFFFKWLPKDHIADKWIVQQTIEGARMIIDIAGNQVKYDSTAPPEPGSLAQPTLADFFSKLVGHEFTVTFGKDMGVEKVDGREEFIKKVGGVNPQMEAILKKMLTEEALRQMVNPTFGLNPPNEVAVGGSWENKSTMNLGPLGMYEMTTKYTYKGKDQTQTNLDRIEVNAALKYLAPTDQQDGLLFKIKGGTLTSLDPTPDMAARNFILYDPAAGRVAKSSMVVKLKGVLNVSIGGTDTTIDLTQEQVTTTEAQDSTFIEMRK